MTSVPFPRELSSTSHEDPPDVVLRPRRVVHLPFRRMSLTSVRSSLSGSIPALPTLSQGIQDQVSTLKAVTPPFISPRKPRRRSHPTSLARPTSDELLLSLKLPDAVDTQEHRDRRWKVLMEFHETERTYLQGLDLIYFHFLQPLIVSLESAKSILTRTELNSVFSNFIDIWNLHRSLYASLSIHFSEGSQIAKGIPPDITPTLQSHFPYLSLYNPFITAFPNTLPTILDLKARNQQFNTFITERESERSCKGLALQSWLLTIVQRCPRYLLLIKDLLKLLPTQSTERDELIKIYALVSKITASFNTSLRTQSQMLELVDLQKATSNLPFPLISAGRVLLKRESMKTSGRRNGPCELLLFSDCLLWLAPLHPNRSTLMSFGSDTNMTGSANRLRRNSEANLVRRNSTVGLSNSTIVLEQRWIFRGSSDLIDLEVVIRRPGSRDDESSFDILNPEESFTVHATTVRSRDEWVDTIREAKAALLVNLTTLLPNTTLTSSSSNAHIRAMLRASPYSDDEPRLERRLKVDHFIPPVWVPDHKALACMRCSRKFGWLLRRHHCRLCGRCVCSACSNRTFFISVKEGDNKAARACIVCYDAVFPIIEESPLVYTSFVASPVGTLSGLPNWKTAKQKNFDPSVLSLLGNPGVPNTAGLHEEYSSEEHGNPEGDLLGDDDPIHLPNERGKRRYSSPVIALQTPVVTAQAQQDAIKSKGFSIPTSIPREQIRPDNHSPASIDRAITELRRVLTGS